MPTVLNIAGHGKRKNGTFDGGAYGYMTMGEHVYMRDYLFPAMKKYVPKGADVVWHTAYNVYDYGDIVSLAKKYGNDTIVLEWHFDALFMGSPASRGHVIVYDGYVPDDTDLAVRDAIKGNVGVRYSHKGYEGIDGRSNLANANRTAKGGVNYRLPELGFGTSKVDSNVMLNETDKYAKDLVQAIFGKTSGGSSVPFTAKASGNTYTVQKGDTLWSISQANELTVDELANLNNINKEDVLSVGQVLSVNEEGKQAKKDNPSDTNNGLYIVEKGDTLWGIANEHGTTVNELKDANGLSSDTLSIGQELVIPTGNKENEEGADLAYKPLKVGGTATIGTWATHYETGEPISDWIKGKALIVEDKKETSNGASKVAYKLSNDGAIIGWLIEGDLVEADKGQHAEQIKDMSTKDTLAEEGKAEVIEEKSVEEIKEEEKSEVKTYELTENQFILNGKLYEITKD